MRINVLHFAENSLHICNSTAFQSDIHRKQYTYVFIIIFINQQFSDFIVLKLNLEYSYWIIPRSGATRGASICQRPAR